MPTFKIKHARPDGSFVIEKNGVPYHVTLDDPLHQAVAAQAEGNFYPDEELPAPIALPVPDISDRQFAMEMRNMGVFTQAEALAFVKVGDFPAALQALVDALPTQSARDDATLMLAGATTFKFDHPLSAVFAQGFGWTQQQLKDFFTRAAVL